MAEEISGPSDAYLHQYLGAKAEARKVFTNSRFEEVANKFWQLLRNDPANLTQAGVSRSVYTKVSFLN